MNRFIDEPEYADRSISLRTIIDYSIENILVILRFF
jgi:hypothetical protein